MKNLFSLIALAFLISFTCIQVSGQTEIVNTPYIVDSENVTFANADGAVVDLFEESLISSDTIYMGSGISWIPLNDNCAPSRSTIALGSSEHQGVTTLEWRPLPDDEYLYAGESINLSGLLEPQESKISALERKVDRLEALLRAVAMEVLSDE